LELGHLLLDLLVCVIVSSREDERDRFGREIASADQPLVICSMQSIPARRIRLWSSGKIPTTSVRRPISRLKRSSGFVTGMKGDRCRPCRGTVSGAGGCPGR
jgi:hypothetical protein